MCGNPIFIAIFVANNLFNQVKDFYMRKLKSLWLVSVVLLLVSCSMSAKSDKSSEAGTASKGEVVTLNKAEFLQKVFNYEKNATKWVYEGDKPCIIDFYADWCGPNASKWLLF